MPENGSSSVECTIAWANDTTGTVVVTCKGLDAQVVDAGRKTSDFTFVAAHNAVLDMTFTLDDGTATTCQVKWRTVADRFAITQKNGSDPEFALPWLYEKKPVEYCINVGRPDSQGGILIIGTIDTK